MLIIFVVVGCAAGFKYETSKQILVINYAHVATISVVSSGSSEDPSTKIATLAKNPISGQPLRLKKGSYTLVYTGAQGYANGSQSVTLGGKKQVVSISPVYSEDHLKALLDQSSAQIHQVIAANYPNINLYVFDREALIDRGEWYIAKLVYVGADYHNSDDLRLVVQEKSDDWVATPPAIWLTTVEYPAVPAWVLAQANQL